LLTFFSVLLEGDSADSELEKPWSAAEQKKLEQALKKIPASDPQRFETIAKDMGTRSAYECKKRFKVGILNFYPFLGSG
jgi:Myb-like DNA-binding domain